MTRRRLIASLGSHAGRAFTLMEVLLASIISTIIIGAASTVFVVSMRAWDEGQIAYERLHLAQSISGTIERHLRAAQPPSSETNIVFDGLNLSTDEADGHSLSLISNAPGRFPRSAPLSDAAEIEFYYDPEVDDGLYMRVDPMSDDFPFSDGYDILLSENVIGFRVVYYDGYDWLEEWTNTDALPMAVEFYVTFVEDLTDPESRSHEVIRLVSLPRGEVTGSEDGEGSGEEVRTSGTGNN